MFKDNRRDFSKEELDFIPISLLSKKVNVLIIGGGFGALVKLKGLIEKNAKVTVVSKEIISEIKELKYKNLILIEEEYKKEFILDKHFVIISIKDFSLRERIRKDLEDEFKLYLDNSSFEEGNAIVPFSKKENGINISLNTVGGNPKGVKFLYNKVKDVVNEYGDFLRYTTFIRNEVKDKKEKENILSFLINDDFKFYFDKGKEEIVLKLFYENIFR